MGGKSPELSYLIENLDEELDYLYRDPFTASRLTNSEIENSSASRELAERAFLDDDLYTIQSVPRLFSRYKFRAEEIFDDERKAEKVLATEMALRSLEKKGKAEKETIDSIIKNLVERNSLNGILRTISEIEDYLTVHPSVEYDKVEEEYRWRR